MDRRFFLSVATATTAVAAVAGAHSMWAGVADAAAPTETAKGGGRALVVEPVLANDLGGALPFALARFAEGGLMPSATSGVKMLSPLRDVSFHGFAGGAGALAADQLRVVAVHTLRDGTVARHDLWSHAPQRLGGTSPAVLFTAHDDGFSGFEVTHLSAAGKRSAAFFNFMASGSGPQLKPGVYVLAGPRAATGIAPDLGRYGYSGDLRRPVRASTALGLDFPYLSFAVHGEWI